MTRFICRCWTLVFPLMAVIAIATVLFCTGHKDAASAVSNVGTVFVMLANVIYITAFHSQSRWPKVSWFGRLSRLLTFQR